METGLSGRTEEVELSAPHGYYAEIEGDRSAPMLHVYRVGREGTNECGFARFSFADDDNFLTHSGRNYSEFFFLSQMGRFTFGGLGSRLVLFLLAGFFVSYGILMVLVIRMEYTNGLLRVSRGGEERARAIATAVRESMLQGNPRAGREVIESLSGRDGVTVDLLEADDAATVFDGADGNQVVVREHDDGIEVILPIRNERLCRNCHGAGALRGLIRVRASLARQRREVATAVGLMGGYGVLIAVMGGAFILALTRRLILGPLRSILAGVDRFAAGDYDVTIDTRQPGEFAELAGHFNTMARRLSAAHDNLERTVAERTAGLQAANEESSALARELEGINRQLRTVGSLPSRFVRSQQNPEESFQGIAQAIVDELPYDHCAIYILDRRKGVLQCRARAGRKENALPQEILRSALYRGESTVLPPGETGDGRWAAAVPLTHPLRGRCYELTGCTHRECPAYEADEWRCWLMSGTACSSEHDKDFRTCMGCEAFPVNGLLVVSGWNEISERNVSVLEVAAVETAYLQDTFRLIKTERDMIDYLVTLHRASLKACSTRDLDEIKEYMGDPSFLSGLFDGVAVWLGGPGKLVLATDRLGGAPAAHTLRPVAERVAADMNTLETADGDGGGQAESFLFCPMVQTGVLIGVMVFVKRGTRSFTPSERAAGLLLAQQTAFSVENARLYQDVQRQRRHVVRHKEFTEKIITSLNSGMIVLDHEGVTVKANPYAAKLLGRDTEELVGLRIEELFPGIRLDRGKESMEMAVPGPGGRTTQIGYHVSLIREEGRERGRIVLFRDLTEIKELQKRLRRKERFSVLGEMTSWVAHEVKNPLFGIKSIADILVKSADDGQTRAFAKSIIGETERLGRLVEDLLDYGKPIELQREIVSLGNLIGDAAGLLSSDGRSVAVSYESEVDDRLLLDRDRMLQVLLNLFRNGAEAGAGSIECRLRTSSDGDLTLTVTDDGEGLAASDRKRLLKPFYTTKKTGTGLGLAISRKIVAEHGGEIALDDARPRGTRVTLTLPAKTFVPPKQKSLPH